MKNLKVYLCLWSYLFTTGCATLVADIERDAECYDEIIQDDIKDGSGRCTRDANGNKVDGQHDGQHNDADTSKEQESPERPGEVIEV